MGAGQNRPADRARRRLFDMSDVPADDLDFTGDLHADTSLAEFRTKKMGSSQLAAHCFQIKRNAEALGLLAK
jgi:hypothetical protein